jgi:hypothetical protein
VWRNYSRSGSIGEEIHLLSPPGIELQFLEHFSTDSHSTDYDVPTPLFDGRALEFVFSDPEEPRITPFRNGVCGTGVEPGLLTL